MADPNLTRATLSYFYAHSKKHRTKIIDVTYMHQQAVHVTVSTYEFIRICAKNTINVTVQVPVAIVDAVVEHTRANKALEDEISLRRLYGGCRLTPNKSNTVSFDYADPNSITEIERIIDKTCSLMTKMVKRSRYDKRKDFRIRGALYSDYLGDIKYQLNSNNPDCFTTSVKEDINATHSVLLQYALNRK